MFHSLLDDGLNPRFVYLSPVFRDEIGAAGQLANERLAAHIVEAVDALHARSVSCGEDELNVVRDLAVEFLAPVTQASVLRIDVWLEALDETTCTYAFLCSSEDGLTPHARGERSVSRVDAERFRPATWSEAFVERQSSILRTLHGCA